MSLEYQRLGHKAASANYRAKTINLSSTGVLFESQDHFQAGDQLRLFLDWPIRIEDQIDLVLVIVGRIVRTSGTSVGAKILKYQLRRRLARHETDVEVHSPS